MHLTISSFQGSLRIPEDVSIQLLHCSTEMDLSARDIENKDNDKHGQTGIQSKKENIACASSNRNDRTGSNSTRKF